MQSGIQNSAQCRTDSNLLLQSELAFQGSHMAPAAMGLLDSLCGLYLKDEPMLHKLAAHRHYGQMLVDAAIAGLPRPKSKQVQLPPLPDVHLQHMLCLLMRCMVLISVCCGRC